MICNVKFTGTITRVIPMYVADGTPDDHREEIVENFMQSENFWSDFAEFGVIDDVNYTIEEAENDN